MWFWWRKFAEVRSLKFSSCRGGCGERSLPKERYGESLNGRESNTQPFHWEASTRPLFNSTCETGFMRMAGFPVFTCCSLCLDSFTLVSSLFAFSACALILQHSTSKHCSVISGLGVRWTWNQIRSKQLMIDSTSSHMWWPVTWT